MKKYLRKIFFDQTSKRFWVINDFLGIVIIASLVLVLLETDPALNAKYRELFRYLEYAIGMIFMMEYFTYIYIAEKKRSYIFSFYGIIDLLSIAPTFLNLMNLEFLRTLRIIRLLRLFRLLKLVRILEFIQNRYEKEKIARQILKINVAIYLVAFFIALLICSIILFHIEEGVEGGQIVTIEDALWSTISSLSAVGFGDTFPVSFPGRMFLGFVMILGGAFLSFAIFTIGRFLQAILFGEEIENELKELAEAGKQFSKEHKRLLENDIPGGRK
ncbi:MAG: hypothetical protein A3B96_04275 [Candidatus Spechtbacteria bacterium RIFCSPHIGHO2_02_FULL_43_15b]|uniref:Ion transport domain-containing protein n=1 Tax=Candidatus Spechtbacteria bacterium RIFCSPHIGHO2_01_FULL_43_30 TaxID=1802158 RepID=A0A1G2H844_9BACT|nr:MAG: hypothetical protein A2827_01840 [Candidatus Spechtbacteria bacterium RIFCSPHIGHO2_01_FULL_43_30]OGZ58551.1 MAG: hypothetical protein A3B96_04275 [Candidatus Spechtbacteria bacterium RIFCSPHIGHO2_02_FULL_43_15b]